MHVLDLPVTMLRTVLESGAPVYLPINPVEYHGPHLSLRNDAVVSLGLSKELHARLAGKHPDWPYLEASPIELGFEPTHGPGSRYVQFKTLGKIVREAVRALCEVGCKRFVLMTFHGAPLHSWALEEGVREAERHGAQAFSPLNLVMEKMLTVTAAEFAPAYAHVEDAAERESMMSRLGADFHAGFFETSMALHYAPETVAPDYIQLPPCPDFAPDKALARASRAAKSMGKTHLSEELNLAAEGRAWQMLRPFPGYTGRPHRATAQAGAVFAKAIVDVYAERAEQIFTGQAKSPTPIFGWLRAASLAGRIGSPSRPNAIGVVASEQ